MQDKWFKFIITEEVEIRGKEDTFIIRGRAQYQGYGNFMYMCQAKYSLDNNKSSLDFTQCFWESEDKLYKNGS